MPASVASGTVADGIAGDYDFGALSAEVDTNVAASPLLLYVWAASPASKKAMKSFEVMGAEMKTIFLDANWEEGNKVRSVLGKKVGRPSVPCIFIGGEYVGGYEDGPTAEAPGLVPLAFAGRLRPMLIQCGALARDPKVDMDVEVVKKEEVVVAALPAVVVSPVTEIVETETVDSETADAGQ